MFKYFTFILVILCVSCGTQTDTPKTPQKEIVEEIPIANKARQDSLKEIYLENGAYRKGTFSIEYQEEIDKGLAIDSTIAEMWQKKAMPLFKQGKHEIAMPFLDKAVKYDRQRYLDYRAFMKCIFMQSYRDAIVDFEDYQEEFGYGYVMDHTYDFHIALSYLQLNEFEKAEKIFEKDIARQKEEKGEDYVHQLDLFYWGISLYEQKKYEEAIAAFDRSLEKYPTFADVQIYKGLALKKLGRQEEAESVYNAGMENGKKGYTINEDNVIYIRYPYQLLWDQY